MEPLEAVVVDCGSSTIRAGFAGNDEPLCCFSSVVGRTRHTGIAVGSLQQETYVGSEAQAKRGLVSLEYPIERGVVTNWHDMEKIWDHMYSKELNISPKERPILLTEPPKNPKSNREKMTTSLFETYEVPATYVALQPLLSIYASGRGSCISLSSGDGLTHTLAVYEGYCIENSIFRSPIAGLDLTNYLAQLFTECGYFLLSSAEREIVREIKNKQCYVARDFEDEMKRDFSDVKGLVEMPDGCVVEFGSERFRCPEALFRPSLLGIESRGIHEILYDSILNCPIDSRSQFLNNIILSGGTTLFPGFGARLKRELEILANAPVHVSVIEMADRMNSVWIGGSILGSLSTFQSWWMTKDEYDEFGPGLIHKKCF